MIALAVVVVVIIGRLAVRRGWRGTKRARSWWEANRAAILAWVRGAPATFIYLAILSVTTWVLVGTNPQVAHALLEDQSTNLHHLSHDPVHVLVRSAFWLSSYELLLWVVLFLVVLAPAEHWLGTSRWLVVFVSGHIGATILTAAGIWLAIRSGVASHRLEDVVDVGVSYGFASLAAIFAFRLEGRWRLIWIATLVAVVVVGIAFDASFTAYGHTVAVVIGFSLYPLTRAPSVRARARLPILDTAHRR